MGIVLDYIVKGKEEGVCFIVGGECVDMEGFFIVFMVFVDVIDEMIIV